MPRVALNESASVTIDAFGNATAKVGPLTAREVWYPQNVHISANANPINEATCKLYVGVDISPGNFRDESLLGSSGDSTGACSADRVTVGSYIWARWIAGDAGARAVLTVTGFRDV